MISISVEMYEKNGVEVIMDDNGTLWLNEKNIEVELEHQNLPVTTRKYHLDFRKHQNELIE